MDIADDGGFAIRAHLADALGLEVSVAGDAQALALGERWIGAARNCDNFLAMVVSTGIGGGLVVDGRLLRGELGNAGHLGHVVVVPDGRRCGCGGQGCVEAEASGTALRAITGADPALASPALRRRTGTLVGRAVASVVATLKGMQGEAPVLDQTASADERADVRETLEEIKPYWKGVF